MTGAWARLEGAVATAAILGGAVALIGVVQRLAATGAPGLAAAVVVLLGALVAAGRVGRRGRP
jgi:hypothetical protein